MMKTRWLTMMGAIAVFALSGVASASLLTNGDFELGENDPTDETQPNTLNPVDWTENHSGGWSNREINEQMPDGHSYALGNAGGFGATASQEVGATAGLLYKLSADSVIDAWWWANGYLGLEFLDSGGAVLPGSGESDHWNPGGNDIGIPLTSYSVTLLAPDGTVGVRALLGAYGDGGTVRFDNAVLEVIPEPATLGLFGLAGLTIWIGRRLRV